MLSLLWALMTTTKLVDDVRIEIISMQILSTDLLPILITIMQFLFFENTPHSCHHVARSPWYYLL